MVDTNQDHVVQQQNSEATEQPQRRQDDYTETEQERMYE